MGWWGHESSANDLVHILLESNVPERLDAGDRVEVTGPHVEKALTEAEQALDAPRATDEDAAVYVGVVRVALAKGLTLPPDRLRRALQLAQDLLDNSVHLESFSDPEERWRHLAQEIAWIEEALAGGQPVVAPAKGLLERLEDVS